MTIKKNKVSVTSLAAALEVEVWPKEEGDVGEEDKYASDECVYGDDYVDDADANANADANAEAEADAEAFIVDFILVIGVFILIKLVYPFVKLC